ncbi:MULTISPECIES: GntR family transcriptional regulator [Shouchella]|uniref:GntR family transcriptional regulator n=2 Tax=Shouchella TaxID=2893057 RepID=A0ABY7W4J3_9BACI|nr:MULTISPECIES: GntR family transcriptional regulator [Shouchella]MED4129537.1 GntR family transcriptional regulator [Shouchella miscanthi]WDF02802.1 GntR family transcriptional regulator [Shouchella hunanensis]GAF22310.1 transcriptional regulator of N-Acetylglucosamine utilization, GntR family [Bacillus sp. JCM 19047]
MIDKQSPIPIYYQIEELIHKQIEDGLLKPGDALPSEREFADRYQISRMTVRQGINNLVQKKQLVREKGRGTFVAHHNIEQSLTKTTSFSEDMVNRNMVPESKLLSFKRIKADADIANLLQVASGTEIYSVFRVRLANQIPIATEQAFIPTDIAPHLTETILHSSLYAYFEHELGYEIDHSEQTIRSVLANKEDAHLLDISEGDPLLAIRRQAITSTNRVLELVYTRYRGDRYHFVTRMSR